MQIRLGMSPISWSNDDLPQLGSNTSLETCLRETREAGFSGTETGGKFPNDAAALSKVLAAHDLSLVSGWYPGRLLSNDLASEIKRIAPQLELFKTCRAAVIVYGETFDTIQNQPLRPLASRPKLADFDLVRYGRDLSALAEHCAAEGVPLTFHHHMGTAVESESEVDQLMKHSSEAVGLLLDTGHMLFAGGDCSSVIRKHGARINHVHAKDVRRDILACVDRNRQSFLDWVQEGIFTVPGDGTIAFELLLQQLHDCGYQGWIIVEAEQDPAQANPLEYARIGFRSLHQAATQAGYKIVR